MAARAVIEGLRFREFQGFNARAHTLLVARLASGNAWFLSGETTVLPLPVARALHGCQELDDPGVHASDVSPNRFHAEMKLARHLAKSGEALDGFRTTNNVCHHCAIALDSHLGGSASNFPTPAGWGKRPFP